MSKNNKEFLFALADALDMDLKLKGFEICGTRKTQLDLFEGYSPNISTSIINSLTDFYNGVIGVHVQVWGNLNIILLLETRYNKIDLFVLDRSKLVDGFPWTKNQWSREACYRFIESGLKAIYTRIIYDNEWTLVEDGPKRMRRYNLMRENGKSASEAHLAWNEGY